MSDYALKYNNMLLQEAVPGAQVVNVTVQPIPIAFTMLDRVADDGSLPVRRRLDKRQIQVEIELPFSPAVADYATNARKVRVWAESSQESPLVLPDYPGKYLNSVLTAIDNFSLNEWYKPLKLTFTAFNDPYFNSDAESTGAVGSAIVIQGDAPATPTITHQITAALTNPQWTLVPGYVIQLSGTYTSGTIVIDTKKGYVSKDDVSIMPSLSPASRFYRFPKGGYVITGPAGGQIAWRERWCD